MSSAECQAVPTHVHGGTTTTALPTRPETAAATALNDAQLQTHKANVCAVRKYDENAT